MQSDLLNLRNHPNQSDKSINTRIFIKMNPAFLFHCSLNNLKILALKAQSFKMKRKFFITAGQWLMLSAIFFMPLNKPLTNTALFFALICSLIGPDFFERLKQSAREPVALMCTVWLIILVFFSLHEYDSQNSWRTLGAMKALCYPLIASTLLTSDHLKKYGLYAFFGAGLIIISISWVDFVSFFILHNNLATDQANQFTVLKDYSQQALMTLVFFSLAMAFSKSDQFIAYKFPLRIISGFALFNVLFVLQSRSAYIVAIPLLIFWLYEILKSYSLKIKISVVVLVIVTLFGSALSPRAQKRIHEAQQDIVHYLGDHAATSVGIRLELWKRSLPIIASAPFFGNGLGQWQARYRDQTKDIKNFGGFEMKHPHQESLWILSEQGIVGYFIYISLLISLLIYTRCLDNTTRHFYQSLLLIYIFFGLANCVLLDFSHRHLFLLLLCCIPTNPKSDKAL